MNILRCLVILVITNLTLFSQTQAQIKDNPLEPFRELQLRDYIGVQIGFGQNWQVGEYAPECEDCIFKGGVGNGFDMGIFYEKELFRNFYGGLQLNYHTRNIESKFIENEKVAFETVSSIFYDSIPMNIEHTGQFSHSYFGLNPFVYYNPFEFFSVRAGLNILFPMSSNFSHTLNPTQRTITLLNGETGRPTSANKTVEDGEIKNLTSPLLGLDLQIGIPIRIRKKSVLSPTFGYNFGLGQITSTNTYSSNSWRILLEFKYNINSNN
jgi:hypothetical protein